MNTQITISGYVVGPIWQPGFECFKRFAYDVTRERRRIDGADLRDHVLAITNDGDFQHCAIAHGEVTITMTRHDKDKVRRVSRSIPLDRFPSIADCLHDDPDWFPDYGDEE